MVSVPIHRGHPAHSAQMVVSARVWWSEFDAPGPIVEDCLRQIASHGYIETADIYEGNDYYNGSQALPVVYHPSGPSKEIAALQAAFEREEFERQRARQRISDEEWEADAVRREILRLRLEVAQLEYEMQQAVGLRW